MKFELEQILKQFEVCKNTNPFLVFQQKSNDQNESIVNDEINVEELNLLMYPIIKYLNRNLSRIKDCLSNDMFVHLVESIFLEVVGMFKCILVPIDTKNFKFMSKKQILIYKRSKEIVTECFQSNLHSLDINTKTLNSINWVLEGYFCKLDNLILLYEKLDFFSDTICKFIKICIDFNNQTDLSLRLSKKEKDDANSWINLQYLSKN